MADPMILMGSIALGISLLGGISTGVILLWKTAQWHADAESKNDSLCRELINTADKFEQALKAVSLSTVDAHQRIDALYKVIIEKK